MSTLAYSLMAAAGGAGGENHFFGVLRGGQGVSTNNIYPMIYNSSTRFGRFTRDWQTQKGGGIFDDSNGNVMFSTASKMYQGGDSAGDFCFGQAKVNNVSSIDPLTVDNNNVQFINPFRPNGTLSQPSNPQQVMPLGVDIEDNMIHNFEASNGEHSCAITKFPTGIANFDGSGDASVKAAWSGFNTTTGIGRTNYAGCRNYQSGDNFYVFGSTDANSLGKGTSITKWDMNNPTGTPAVTWSKSYKLDSGGGSYQWSFVNSGSSDTSGNLYVGGGWYSNPNQPMLMKVNTDGTFQWAKYARFGNGQPYGYGSNTNLSNIKCSKDGTHLYALQSVYAMQYTTWDSISNSSRKTILTKINPSNGTVLWHRGLRGIANGDWSSGELGLAVDNDGNAYMTVYSNQDYKLDANCTNDDHMMIKVNSSGVMQWANVFKNDPFRSEELGSGGLSPANQRKGGWHQQINISQQGEGDGVLWLASATTNSNKNTIAFANLPSDGSGTVAYNAPYTFTLSGGNIATSSYYKSTAMEARGLETLNTLQYDTLTVNTTYSDSVTVTAGASNEGNQYAQSNFTSGKVHVAAVEL